MTKGKTDRSREVCSRIRPDKLGFANSFSKAELNIVLYVGKEGQI